MALANLLVKIRAEGIEQTKAGLQSLETSLHSVGRAAVATGAGLAAIGTIALAAFAKSAFDTAVRLDSLTRALAGVSRNSDDLQGQLTRLREIARLPGLGFEEAIQGSLRLQSAGLSAQLAERALKAFGNAIAGSGGSKDVLDGVTLALSQIASKGKLSAEEIGQLSERLPMIRKLLQGAFGTSDTEAIQKMGYSAVQAISMIVAEAEKLPKATSGIQNLLDNISDGLKAASEPFGQGLVEMIEGAGVEIDNIIANLKEIGTFFGEIFASIGRSGIIKEILGTFTNLSASIGIATESGADFLIGAAGAFLSVINNLPGAFVAAKEAIDAIIFNLQIAGQRLYTNMVAGAMAFQAGIHEGIQELSKALSNPLEFLKVGQHADNAVRAISPESLLSRFQSYQSMADAFIPDYKKLPSADRFNVFQDTGRFSEIIKNNIRPLRALPEGLNFANGESVTTQGQKTNSLDTLLAKIEQNTRKTAEASLKEVSSGGERGAATAIELRRAGGIGRASGDYRMAAGYHASNLERQLVALTQDNLRAIGAGLSPARAW